MNIINMHIGPLAVNCYIVYKKEGGSAAVIDPGGDAKKIIAALEKHKLNVKYILLTHGHYDHISGVSELAEKTGAPAYLHNCDLELYKSQKSIIENISGRGLYAEFENYILKNRYSIDDDLYFEIIETPGHSKGCVSIIFPENKIMFTGDTLFCEDIGRTDLPGGDELAIMHSLKKLMNYRDYTAYPGHGPRTTINFESENNYYIKSFS